jgi:hypothetical protein
LKQTPTVRLAYGGPPEALAAGLAHTSKDPNDLPALLVSYVYLPLFIDNLHRYEYRNWAMDSGAFSAHNSGTEIVLQDYVDTVKVLIEQDPTLVEVFALDVIGDWKASLRNTEEMWRLGVPAIPCFHFGEPWDLLKGLAKDYPKVALGGLVGQAALERDKWIGQCFARVWPKKIHGFGLSGEKTIMAFPFHSVDATNWEIGPCKFGRWASYGGKMSVRGSEQNLRAEVEWYLALEKRARHRWKKEMALLATQGPDLRLSYSTGGGGKVSNIAFSKDGQP